MERDPTTRFSDRVEHYVRWRPRYPQALLDFFRDELGVGSDAVIADIGSGTGFLAELFLADGSTVNGVEPNEPMRLAAEELLQEYKLFISIEGTAEETGLAAESIDVITVAQAFHWFDVDRARREFMRVLKPNGIVALIWNNRLIDTSEFSKEYEEMVRRYSSDHDYVARRADSAMDDGTMREFFGSEFNRVVFDNEQRFDFEGIRGRLLSSSYAPLEGEPNHQPMMDELGRLFERHQQNGEVRFEYETEMFYGSLQ